MLLKLVIFDAEGTFIKIHPPVGEYYAGLFEKVGLKLDPKDVQEKIHSAYRLIFRQNSLNQRWNSDLCREAWRSLFELVFRDYRLEPWFEELFTTAYQHFSTKDCVKPIDGFPDTAKRLRTLGFKLCVLSNWDARLHSVLSGWILDPLFDRVYTGCEIGYLKPNPASFLNVLKDFNVSPESALMVGDSYDDDIEPAARLGLKTIHYQGEDYRDVEDQIMSLLLE